MLHSHTAMKQRSKEEAPTKRLHNPNPFYKLHFSLKFKPEYDSEISKELTLECVLLNRMQAKVCHDAWTLLLRERRARLIVFFPS